MISIKGFMVLLLTAVLLTGGGPAVHAAWWEDGLKTLKTLTDDTGTDQGAEPTLGELGAAFKEALQIGTDRVVGQLGVIDGFNADGAIHIPLPETLQSVKSILAKFGMSAAVDDLELKLNRAAEAATPKAKALFFDAIKQMTFTDLKGIYNGPDDSATQYFKGKMTEKLAAEMQPIVASTLAEVGAIQAYDSVMGQYADIPFVPDVKANLQDYVVQKGMDGIFYYVAKEEAAIRNDPQKQTTALLKKVFGIGE